MANVSEIDRSDESWRNGAGVHWSGVDWPDMVRLAVIVSVFAGAAAMALVGRVPETAIVVTVIVLATMASWFHLEHAGRQPRPAHVRRHGLFNPR
jgi:hypothetical protein